MALLNQSQQQYYQTESELGNYQFTSLDNIINQFMVVYVGEDKIINKTKRTDVAFHAQRALQELSFDTFKSTKGQEIIVPSTLQVSLPQDYINYTKISWVDSAGIKHLLYPTSKTSLVYSDDTGMYSPSILDAFNEGFTTDTTNLTFTENYGTIAYNSTTNQLDFTNSSWKSRANWSSIAPEVGKNYSLTYTISNVPYLNPAQINDPNQQHFVGKVTPYLYDEFGNEYIFPTVYDNGTYTYQISFGQNLPSTIAYTSTFFFEMSEYPTAQFNGSISNLSLVEATDTSKNDESTTWSNYKSNTPSENNNDDYEDDTYWPMDGSRFGLDPQHAQANGSFYIDHDNGKIHFSSNISGKTIVLDYISDSLGTEGEMQVHKFAEEALYKWISHAILASKANTPEYLVARYKKERFAAIRTAKLRLSSIKLEEITQILRGKSKQIKH